MATKGVKSVARAIRDHSKNSIDHHVNQPCYAIVRDLDPIEAELTNGNLVLTEDDDLVLSQWVRRYDADHTIDVEDTLVVHLMHNGDWLATDVLSDTDVT